MSEHVSTQQRPTDWQLSEMTEFVEVTPAAPPGPESSALILCGSLDLQGHQDLLTANWFAEKPAVNPLSAGVVTALESWAVILSGLLDSKDTVRDLDLLSALWAAESPAESPSFADVEPGLELDHSVCSQLCRLLSLFSTTLAREARTDYPVSYRCF